MQPWALCLPLSHLAQPASTMNRLQLCALVLALTLAYSVFPRLFHLGRFAYLPGPNLEASSNFSRQRYPCKIRDPSQITPKLWVDLCPHALTALGHYSSTALQALPNSVEVDVCVDLDLSIYTAHFELLRSQDHMGLCSRGLGLCRVHLLL